MVPRKLSMIAETTETPGNVSKSLRTKGRAQFEVSFVKSHHCFVIHYFQETPAFLHYASPYRSESKRRGSAFPPISFGVPDERAMRLNEMNNKFLVRIHFINSQGISIHLLRKNGIVFLAPTVLPDWNDGVELFVEMTRNPRGHIYEVTYSSCLTKIL